jgi:Amt family ammonium transporter
MSTVFPTDSSLFGTCYTKNEGDTDAVLLCVAESMEVYVKNEHESLRSWLLTIMGTVVFLMQLGFAMLCAGCVRRKNTTNTLLKNVLDACVASVAFYLFGFAFAFGGDDVTMGATFIGTKNFALTGDVDYAFWFFENCFAAATVTIIAGTLAERCQMSAYFAYSFVMAAIIYPFIVHSIWSSNGFLSAFAKDPYRGVGVLDFAGSGVVHLTGGITALIATIILGPRKGRFTNSKGVRLETPRDIPGHSVSLQILGFIILWVGCKY